MPANGSLEVHSPRLHRSAGKLQCAERDGDLSSPPIVSDTRLHEPDAIPTLIDVTSFIRNLRVPLRPRRTDDKFIRIAFIVKCIENDLNRVARFDSKVLLQLRNNDAPGLGI